MEHTDAAPTGERKGDGIMREEDIQRIDKECSECLSDRTEFCDEAGIKSIMECEHCRDKMNLIAEIRRLRAIGADSLEGNASGEGGDRQKQ